MLHLVFYTTTVRTGYFGCGRARINFKMPACPARALSCRRCTLLHVAHCTLASLRRVRSTECLALAQLTQVCRSCFIYVVCVYVFVLLGVHASSSSLYYRLIEATTQWAQVQSGRAAPDRPGYSGVKRFNRFHLRMSLRAPRRIRAPFGVRVVAGNYVNVLAVVVARH